MPFSQAVVQLRRIVGRVRTRLGVRCRNVYTTRDILVLESHFTTHCGAMAAHCTPGTKSHYGSIAPSISQVPKKREPEIVTITPTLSQTQESIVTLSGAMEPPDDASAGSEEGHHAKNTSMSYQKGPLTSWKDKLLKKNPGKPGKGGSTILWLPGSGRHVSEGADSYRPFTHIVRTLHLEDALAVCATGRIPPKKVVTFSSIDSRQLAPSHPCAGVRVLWFSARPADGPQDEDAPDWYGNVEFAVDARLLLERWRHAFLVEMMTTPTHTTSRLLVTNSDYSAVLPRYDRRRDGGPWRVAPDGRQLALASCSRYLFRGTNRHEHVLEFMLEVSPEDEAGILNECRLSFRNHEDAIDTKTPHVCNRYQRAGQPCPTPFPRDVAAASFFQALRHNNMLLDLRVPKLSKSARQYLDSFLEEEKRQTLLSLYPQYLCMESQSILF